MDAIEYNYWCTMQTNADIDQEIAYLKKEFWELKLKMLKHENVETINKNRI